MRKRIRKAVHSGDRKPGEDHGQQPSSQQPQSQERGSDKGSYNARSRLRAFFTFEKSPRSAPEAITPSYAQPPSQSDSLFTPGRDPALSSASGRESEDSATVSSGKPEDSATASSGEPEDSATVIAVSILQDSAATTIAATTVAPVNLLSQAVRNANCSSDTKNSPTVSPSISSRLWQEALEIAQKSLTKYNLPSLEIGSFQSQCAVENIQSLLAELDAAYRENKDRQWRYKDRQGNDVIWVERLGKVLKTVDKYAKIVNTAIQHHPNVTALVWAGARTILQVTLNHVEAMECFEETMVTIMDKMAVSAFYAGIYEEVELQIAVGDTDKLHEVLHMALPELYAAIIVFSIKARQYFDARCKSASH
ncbi:hypothetical protein EV426DRAFT_190016 [Tirmania nivea]|nr:hypothetical protein EV426DRAFT_190016 [Tirmania nivea]